MDWRDLSGEPFDAIASIGMVEHVGNANIDAYAARLSALLRPGGWLLNHGIARLRHTDPEAGPFSERFVFPDAAPLHLSRILLALERAGSSRRHVEGFRADYAETLAHWSERLDANHERALELAGPGAHARLAAVPARRAPRVRVGLHRPLPGARAEAGRPARRAAPRRVRRATRRAVGPRPRQPLAGSERA